MALIARLARASFGRSAQNVPRTPAAGREEIARRITASALSSAANLAYLTKACKTLEGGVEGNKGAQRYIEDLVAGAREIAQLAPEAAEPSFPEIVLFPTFETLAESLPSVDPKLLRQALDNGPYDRGVRYFWSMLDSYSQRCLVNQMRKRTLLSIYALKKPYVPLKDVVGKDQLTSSLLDVLREAVCEYNTYCRGILAEATPERLQGIVDRYSLRKYRGRALEALEGLDTEHGAYAFITSLVENTGAITGREDRSALQPFPEVTPWPAPQDPLSRRAIEAAEEAYSPSRGNQMLLLRVGSGSGRRGAQTGERGLVLKMKCELKQELRDQSVSTIDELAKCLYAQIREKVETYRKTCEELEAARPEITRAVNGVQCDAVAGMIMEVSAGTHEDRWLDPETYLERLRLALPPLKAVAEGTTDPVYAVQKQNQRLLEEVRKLRNELASREVDRGREESRRRASQAADEADHAAWAPIMKWREQQGQAVAIAAALRAPPQEPPAYYPGPYRAFDPVRGKWMEEHRYNRGWMESPYQGG